MQIVLTTLFFICICMHMQLTFHWLHMNKNTNTIYHNVPLLGMLRTNYNCDYLWGREEEGGSVTEVIQPAPNVQTAI